MVLGYLSSSYEIAGLWTFTELFNAIQGQKDRDKEQFKGLMFATKLQTGMILQSLGAKINLKSFVMDGLTDEPPKNRLTVEKLDDSIERRRKAMIRMGSTPEYAEKSLQSLRKILNG